MEKKARVKRLNHQDDVKRSWAAAYLLEENLLEENLLEEELVLEAEQGGQTELDAEESNLQKSDRPTAS